MNNEIREIWSLARSLWQESYNRWNDQTRRRFDKQITEPLTQQSNNLINVVDEAENSLRRATQELDKLEKEIK